MLTNIIGGLQGIVDHVLVGHFVGYNGNAAIGVAWQIIIVVIVFITWVSVSSGVQMMTARVMMSATSLGLSMTAPAQYSVTPSMSAGALVQFISRVEPYTWEILRNGADCVLLAREVFY